MEKFSQIIVFFFLLMRKLFHSDSPKLHVTINRLMRVHSILCDTTITLNEGYGLSILFVALTSLLHLIITPYVLITQAGNSTNYKFLIAQASWCIFHIGRLLVIVQPCYSTALRVISWNIVFFS